MHSTIFREYDIRGKVGTEFNLDQVYDLACAIAFYFVQQQPKVKRVVVGMDGRTHSPLIKDNVCRALIDSGLDVLFIGVCPSPVLYFALYTMPVDAGIMITASHNPKEYNGLKLCLGGASVWGLQVNDIHHLFTQRKALVACRSGVITEQSIIETYVAWLARHFPLLHSMPLAAVIDCGNGAGGAVLPALVKAMNWSQVTLLYADVDGTYPHHEADPIQEKNMLDVKRVLQETACVVGVGLDGDADRMACMTKQGYLVPGDKLLSVFARDVLAHYPGANIIVDIKSSAGLLELLDRWAARTHLSPSGHAIIKDQMKKYGALLGGELSCHFFFHDRYFGYDDGMYAMMRLFEILVTKKTSLQELLEGFPHKISSQEMHISCPDTQKKGIVEKVKQQFAQRSDVTLITIDGVRALMPYGWGLVRASNTQPMLSLRFESDSEQGLQQVKKDFCDALCCHVDTQVLQE